MSEILGFLAADDRRFDGFLTATGLAVGDLRAASVDPAFAEGVLDHLCADEAALVAFADAHGYRPEAIDHLRQSFGWDRRDD